MAITWTWSRRVQSDPPGLNPTAPASSPPGWGRPLFRAGRGVFGRAAAPLQLPYCSGTTAAVVSTLRDDRTGNVVHSRLSVHRSGARGASPDCWAVTLFDMKSTEEAGAGDRPTTTGRPESAALLLVRDAGLRDEVRRVAAAADCGLIEPAEPVGRQAWSATPLVVLDRAAALASVQAGLARRPGVLLVGPTAPVMADWQAATAVGAERVIGLPEGSAELVAVLGERPQSGGRDGAVVAVLGGCGGAGASVFAAALALTAQSTGFRPDVLLIDGDPRGGGLDLVLGIEDRPGLRWPGLVIEAGRVSAGALHDALPSAGAGLHVLSGERGSTAGGPPTAGVRAVLAAGRAAGDLVICDVGRAGGPADPLFLESADLVVLVVPAELRACAAAESMTATVAAHNPNQGLVVRGPAPGGLRDTDVARTLDLPLLASMRPQPRLAQGLERHGLRLRRRSPLRGAADAVLDVLAERPVARGRVA